MPPRGLRNAERGRERLVQKPSRTDAGILDSKLAAALQIRPVPGLCRRLQRAGWLGRRWPVSDARLAHLTNSHQAATSHRGFGLSAACLLRSASRAYETTSSGAAEETCTAHIAGNCADALFGWRTLRLRPSFVAWKAPRRGSPQCRLSPC